MDTVLLLMVTRIFYGTHMPPMKQVDTKMRCTDELMDTEPDGHTNGQTDLSVFTKKDILLPINS